MKNNISQNNLSRLKYAVSAVPVSAMLFLCLAAAPDAHAQADLPLTVTLTPSGLVGDPGDVLEFTGTLSNPVTNSNDVFLNGDSTTFNGPATDLTVNPMGNDPFFDNAPVSLAPGDAYSGEYFDVAISPTAQPGTYFGTFLVTGGMDGNASDTVASEDFSVTVLAPAAVPEASTTVSLGILLALGGAGLWRARRRSLLSR
ncbi:MAG: hypothetical protein ACRYFS_11900 [Janthinobacterium lividum]